ncbi:MAG: hypothetical protein KAY24_04325 [Candidatus Eisenbacteria sp.]|nr:hypothetical protein [Candidatus Eisenbacteria bacterium]
MKAKHLKYVGILLLLSAVQLAAGSLFGGAGTGLAWADCSVAVSPTSSWFSDQSGHNEATVAAWFDDGGGAPVRGFHIELTYPAAYVHVVGIAEGDFLSGSGDPTIFYYDDDGAGNIEINAAILGTTSGASGTGTLFTITFDGSGTIEGCGDIDFDNANCIIRDVQNNTLPASYTDGWISHDLTGPEQPDLSSPTHPENQVTASGNVTVNWDGVSDLPLTCAAGVADYYLKADQSAATVPGPQNYDYTTPSGMPDPYEWSFTLPDGAAYYVHITAYDEVGNPGTPDHYGPFSIDTTPPGNVSDMLAQSGHNAIQLSWTPPADAAVVKIYRKAWSYPEFDDVMAQPAAPAFIGDGVLVGEFPVATTQTTDTFDELERNYYIYTAFAEDEGGNPSSQPAPPEAQDWALSYWLGDFDDDFSFDCDLGGYDGLVDAADLNGFSAVFGLTSVDSVYCNEMDIGPTSDNLETGYPLTDDLIGFEDLMIFSLTYGNTAPLKMPMALGLASASDLMLSLQVAEGEFQPGSEIMATLSISGNQAGFKGLRATVRFNAGGMAFQGAWAGEHLADSGRTFFAALGSGDAIEIDLAILGRQMEITGDGVLARLRFTVLDVDRIELELTDPSLRDPHNAPLLTGIENPILPPNADLPAAVMFRGAVPNPVRTATAFSFALPAEERVKLQVLDVSGRLIKEILNRTLPAGHHLQGWDRCDDGGNLVPAGLYLAHFRAGHITLTRNVLVLR